MSVLDDIVAGVLADLAVRQAQVSEERLRASLAATRRSVTRCRRSGRRAPASSPRSSAAARARATWRRSPDPAALAAAYARGGAHAISVLTESASVRQPPGPDDGAGRRAGAAAAQGLLRHRLPAPRAAPPAPA
ncbi:MAG: hypothetical protein R2734_10430 [Nocardioides sp.]